MNSPVSLGVLPTTTTTTGFYSQRFGVFSFPLWNPGCHSLSHSPAFPPGLYTHECGTAWSSRCCLAHPVHRSACCPSPPRLLSLDECFFCSSLVVRLTYSLIFFGSSGGFLVLNLLSFLWLCEKAEHVCLCLHLGQKSYSCIIS